MELTENIVNKEFIESIYYISANLVNIWFSLKGPLINISIFSPELVCFQMGFKYLFLQKYHMWINFLINSISIKFKW